MFVCLSCNTLLQSSDRPRHWTKCGAMPPDHLVHYRTMVRPIIVSTDNLVYETHCQCPHETVCEGTPFMLFKPTGVLLCKDCLKGAMFALEHQFEEHGATYIAKGNDEDLLLKSIEERDVELTYTTLRDMGLISTGMRKIKLDTSGFLVSVGSVESEEEDVTQDIGIHITGPLSKDKFPA